jgi:high-affinity nickel-transport protein
MEWLMFPLAFIAMGFRHGLDSDHVAAIADMVGTEKRKRLQLSMGLMYALGHGAIVLLIGLLAVVIGAHLPEGIAKTMEILVGTSLILLGAVFIYSIVTSRENYQYVSRFEMIYRMLGRIFGKRSDDQEAVTPFKVGIIGAFVIGVIHGIGAETPTQVALISSTIGLSNLAAASMQIVFFTAGLLISTSIVSLVASYGFRLARFKKMLYIGLGCLTGIYSLALGVTIISGV